MATAYRVKPSDLYEIHDELTAWCFNRAVWVFGTELEAALHSAAHGAKNDQQATQRQQRVMAAWGLGEVKYRDPAGGAASKPGEPVAQTISSETSGSVKL